MLTREGKGVGRKAPASCHPRLWPVCLSALPRRKYKDKQENDCFAWWCLVSMVLAAFGVVKWLVAWSGLGSLITTCQAFPFASESSPVIITRELFPVQNNISTIIIVVALSRGRHPHLGGLTVAYNKHNNKKHDTHNS